MKPISNSPSSDRRSRYPIVLKVGSCVGKIYRSSRVRKGVRYVEFTLVYYDGRARVRRSFADEVEARQEGQSALIKIASGDVHGLKLTGLDVQDYLSAKGACQKFGMQLHEAMRLLDVAHTRLGGFDAFLDAISYYSANKIGELKKATVDVVLAELVDDRQRAGKSSDYLRDLRSRLGMFARAFPGQIGELRKDKIDEWLRRLPGAPRSRNNMATNVTTLVRFAEERRYLPKNSGIGERLARAKEVDSEIEIFTPMEMRRMLDRLSSRRHDLLPFLVLGAYAGLRTAEIRRLDWEDIRWDHGHIYVSGRKSKTGERRMVPIQPILRDWLAEFRGRKGPVCLIGKAQETMQETVEATVLAEDGTSETGTAWKKNGLRHSYASYRLPVIKNAQALALEMGNTPDMVFKHYRELVTDAEAQEYWSLLRQPSREIVVPIRSDGTSG